MVQVGSCQMNLLVVMEWCCRIVDNESSSQAVDILTFGMQPVQQLASTREDQGYFGSRKLIGSNIYELNRSY